MNFSASLKDNAGLLVFIIRLQDWFIVFAGGVIGFFLLEPIKNFPEYERFMPTNYLTALTIVLLLSALWFPVFNIYKSWRSHSILEEIRMLFIGLACSFAGLLAFMVFTKTTEDFSRHWIGLWFCLAFSALILSRMILRMVLRSMRKKGFNLRHVVLVGDPEVSRKAADKIATATWAGLKVSGLFTDDTPLEQHFGLPMLGDLQKVVHYVEENRVDQVWITLPLKDMGKIEGLCNQLSSVAVDVILVPDISSLRLLNHSVTQINGMPIINMSVSPMVGGNTLLKWLEDKTLSLIILALISPLMIIIASAVKLTSPGPVFYRQERISWNGKRFQMLKFRTMSTGVDTLNNGPVWGQATNKPVTGLGRFLRKTSLDELPQFINVLKGDMSIVGPRPERTVFVDQFKFEIDGYMKKHLVKAGITGWAQINGWRGDTSLKKRIEYDLFYIENWSVWMDLKIILMTMTRGMVSKNAC